MTIRCVYHGNEPAFPATDQHPDAVRFFVVDDRVLREDDWRKLVAQAEAAALASVYGNADAGTIAQINERDPEGISARKQAVANARAAMTPILSFAVDAIGGPPRAADIAAVLNPPPPQRSVADRLAKVGITIAELKAEMGK